MHVVRDAQQREGFLDRLGLTPFHHQDTYVGCRQRPRRGLLEREFQGRLPIAAVEESLDFTGHESGMLLMGILELFPGAHVDHREGRPVGAIRIDARQALIVGRRSNFRVLDAGLPGEPFAVQEDAIERFEQLRSGAPVDVERDFGGLRLRLHRLDGVQIRRQIGACGTQRWPAWDRRRRTNASCLPRRKYGEKCATATGRYPGTHRQCRSGSARADAAANSGRRGSAPDRGSLRRRRSCRRSSASPAGA